jgi:hypothetical protein
MFLNMR